MADGLDQRHPGRQIERQTTVDEHDPLHPIRVPIREHRRDERPHRVPDDHGALDARGIQDRGEIVGVCGQPERPIHVGAAPASAQVRRDQACVGRIAGDPRPREVRRGDAVHEQPRQAFGIRMPLPHVQRPPGDGDLVGEIGHRNSRTRSRRVSHS
ncbi:hypothetical protein SRABI128_01254 [Microbacterium sp. Bi128]|nr:hypothetical protein SRABI128_01254 [Microbacterium sp. Bi128]